MKNYSREAAVAKAGLLRFCQRISRGLGRVAQKLVADILYGVSASNSCHLTQIGRSLGELIGIKKTVDRLSRGLQNFTGHEILHENYLQEAEKYIDETTVYAIDESDVIKPYGKAMEALYPVRDGSDGSLAPGYNTLEITALIHGTKTPLPVYERVFSAAEKGFVSQTQEVLDGLKFLTQRFGHGGIRALDRGYDANEYIKYFKRNNEKFIIRVKKNRVVKHRGKPVNIEELAGRYKGKYAFKCTLHGETVRLKVAHIPINISEFGDYPLYLVVVYGFGKTPMLLLTNCQGIESRLCTAIAKMYLLRWKIEEHFRFKKQQYEFEDFRVRSLAAIRTLHLLITLLAGYMALLTQQKNTVTFQLLSQAAQPVPRAKNRKPKQFFHYELAAGFATLLRKTTANLKQFFPPLRCRPPSRQLSLFSQRQLVRLACA